MVLDGFGCGSRKELFILVLDNMVKGLKWAQRIAYWVSSIPRTGGQVYKMSLVLSYLRAIHEDNVGSFIPVLYQYGLSWVERTTT